jgi:hypothetical protein
MNYSNFINRVRDCRRTRTAYPPELLQAVEVLHFEHHIPAKTIARQLLEEEEYKGHSLESLHSVICRHIRRVTESKGVLRRRKPKKARGS